MTSPSQHTIHKLRKNRDSPKRTRLHPWHRCKSCSAVHLCIVYRNKIGIGLWPDSFLDLVLTRINRDYRSITQRQTRSSKRSKLDSSMTIGVFYSTAWPLHCSGRRMGACVPKIPLTQFHPKLQSWTVASNDLAH